MPHDGEDAAVAVDVLQAVTRGKAGQHLARVVGRVSSAVRDWVRGVWDPGPILRVDRARWAAAASLSDMAELTAAWLRGQIASQPGYYGSCDVDEHLAPGMTDALVALCRAGAVTTGSQAGLVAGPVIQLAWVDAFVPDGLLSRLRTAARGSGYRVVVHTPASAWVTVTWEQDTARTSTGWVAASHWAWLYQDVGVAAVSELLATTHQVSIVDPQPGRNTLWSWLMDVLTDALVVDGVEPLDEDDDLCPDCDGPDRLVDCLTCFGAAADLDPGDLR